MNTTHTTPSAVPLRVDFAGGWLDVPALSRKGAFIVNCAIVPAGMPLYTLAALEADPELRHSGLGTSAAHAILSGKDAFKSELEFAGWQDPAVILETGLCVWRSGSTPVLEYKFNPHWLDGLMAIRRVPGTEHNTANLAKAQRDYGLIESAGRVAAGAALERSRTNALDLLAAAIGRSYTAQRAEGMLGLTVIPHSVRKYCGSGWGGFALYLFDSAKARATACEHYDGLTPVGPYMSKFSF
jgi:hypothetical protein